MARRRSITSQLYRAARLSNTLGAVASGKPRRIARRARNIAVGRTLARAGVGRWLWKALKDAKLPRVRVPRSPPHLRHTGGSEALPRRPAELHGTRALLDHGTVSPLRPGRRGRSEAHRGVRRGVGPSGGRRGSIGSRSDVRLRNTRGGRCGRRARWRITSRARSYPRTADRSRGVAACWPRATRPVSRTRCERSEGRTPAPRGSAPL